MALSDVHRAAPLACLEAPAGHCRRPFSFSTLELRPWKIAASQGTLSVCPQVRLSRYKPSGAVRTLIYLVVSLVRSIYCIVLGYFVFASSFCMARSVNLLAVGELAVISFDQKRLRAPQIYV